MRYDQGNKKAVLSFGLGVDAAVNSLIGLPTLRQWEGVFDFGENNFVARSINTKFPLCYKPTKHGLPASAEFTDTDFNRPIQGDGENAVILLTNLKNDRSPPPLLSSLIKGNIKDDMSTCSMVRTADVSYFTTTILPSKTEAVCLPSQLHELLLLVLNKYDLMNFKSIDQTTSVIFLCASISSAPVFAVLQCYFDGISGNFGA